MAIDFSTIASHKALNVRINNINEKSYVKYDTKYIIQRLSRGDRRYNGLIFERKSGSKSWNVYINRENLWRGCKGVPIALDPCKTSDIIVIPAYINGLPVKSVSIGFCDSRAIILPSTVDSFDDFSGSIEDVVWVKDNSKEETVHASFAFTRIFNLYINTIEINQFDCSCYRDDVQAALYDFIIPQCRNVSILDPYPSTVDIYTLNKIPPRAFFSHDNDEEDVFSPECVLHVPQGSRRYYQSSLGWKTIKTIVEYTPEEIDEKISEIRQKQLAILDKAYEFLYPKS